MSLEVFFFGAFGLAFGSFGNVLLLRLKRGESLLGRSHCMSCKRILGVFDLIPVLSYALLGGRCRWCSRHISLQYSIVEMFSAVLFILAAILFPTDLPRAVLTAGLLYVLLLACVFDVLYEKLPDVCSLTIAFLGLVLAAMTHHLSSSLLGAALALVWFGGQWILSQHRAVGTGDIFLSSALALWLGFRGTIAMLLLSYVVGAISVLLLLGLGTISMKQKRIAFGPFLAMGAVLSMLGVGQVYLPFF